MRLLYLGSTDLPQTKARAIQIVHTCHALARAGAEVTLVGGRRGTGGRPEPSPSTGWRRIRACVCSGCRSCASRRPRRPACWPSSRGSGRRATWPGWRPPPLRACAPPPGRGVRARSADGATGGRAGPRRRRAARLRGPRAAVVRGGAGRRPGQPPSLAGRPPAPPRRGRLRAGRPDRDHHRVRRDG